LNSKDEDTLKRSFTDTAMYIFLEHPSSLLLKRATQNIDLDEVVIAMKR
jgi:hypothetical protein